MVFRLKCLEWMNVNRYAAHQNKSKLSKNSSTEESIYVLQIAGQKQQQQILESPLLACLSSDQIIQVYDQTDLKLKYKIRNAHDTNASTKSINEIGFFKQNTSMLFSCGDDGLLNCWDLRLDNTCVDKKSPSPSICIDYLKGKRELLCADINLDDNFLLTGTNRNIDDSIIYLFDIRFADRYMFKFCESHSKDITQVRFNPDREKKFCSSSVDGLVCLYDLDMEQENKDLEKNNISDNEETGDDEEEDPDVMEQVFNTDSSVQKLGYLNTNPMVSNSPNQLYAITYTNGLFVWDLNTHDLIFKKEIKSEKEEDYFFDCFYFKSRRDELPLLTSCMSDKNGSIKIIQNEDVLTEINKSNFYDEEEKLNRRMHRDIIRSSYWDDESHNLYTAGEDGFLIKWGLIEKLAAKFEKETSKKRERKDNDDDDDDEMSKESVDFKYKKKF